MSVHPKLTRIAKVRIDMSQVEKQGQSHLNAEWQARRDDLTASKPDMSIRPDLDSKGPTEDNKPAESVEPHEGYEQRYPPVRSLGTGGMAKVWLARQTSLQREVALKVAYSHLQPHQRLLFRAEATCTAWLEHPNIVPVYDAGDEFIVMKRIEGDTLERLLVLERLRLPDVVDVLIKVCDALAFAHSRGVIHRDVKPDNIMVGRFGEVVLMDWGLALQVETDQSGINRAPTKSAQRSLCAGTPGYMAPEMARGDSSLIGYGTDSFLVGATLYRCLTGRLPFDGSDAYEALGFSAENEWPPVLQFAAQAPPRLINLQERAMADRPDERPNINDVRSILRDWLRSANAEAEGKRCHERGSDLLRIARAAGRRSDEAYTAFSEALHYLHRAVTLCPEQVDYGMSRSDAVREFAWAAASAGEPGLARLLKRGRKQTDFDGSEAILAGINRDPVGEADEHRRLTNSLIESRNHLELLGTRVAELETALEQRTSLMGRWRLGVAILALTLAGLFLLLISR